MNMMRLNNYSPAPHSNYLIPSNTMNHIMMPVHNLHRTYSEEPNQHFNNHTTLDLGSHNVFNMSKKHS